MDKVLFIINLARYNIFLGATTLQLYYNQPIQNIMFSNQNSETSLKSFIVHQKLGEGSFASVYKVQRIGDSKTYAMKKVKIGQMKQKQRDNALNEVRVLASISHPNIVNYKQAFFDDPTQSLCIVMEFADAGDVQKKINEHRSNHTYFSESQIWQALIQMTKGLRALHEINILHRDIKCANVFCTKDHKYKLGDLNVSKVAKRGMARTQTGTPYYTSPQVWKDRPYDSKCDIWSLGCVVYEMASLTPPFRASNLKELYTKIQRGIFQRIPAFYSDSLAEIVNQCLRVNPVIRPSASEILADSKVIANSPASQKYALDHDQTKKVNLINTILCPKNLRSLKQALPGAKYDQGPEKSPRPSSVQQKRENSLQRVVSAQNLNVRPPSQQQQLHRVISSPKIAAQSPRKYMNEQIKYIAQRRPSSERLALPIRPPIRKEPISDSRQKQVLADYCRRNSKLVRNNSADLLQKRRHSSKSLENNNINNISNNSAKKRQERESNQKRKEVVVGGFMEDIANRCKNIKQRVEILMANRDRQDRVEKLVNFQRRYAPMQRNSKQKRQESQGSRNESRRNSFELKNGMEPNKQLKVGQRKPSRSLERNPSQQRIQRQNSKKEILSPYLPLYRR